MTTLLDAPVVPQISEKDRAERLSAAGAAWSDRIDKNRSSAQLTYRVEGRGEGAVATRLRAGKHEFVIDELDRVAASVLRVQLARRFHNDAVRDVRRVRAKRTVRWFGLAGHAALPELVVFDDDVPLALPA